MQIHNHFKHADMEAARSGWFECSCCPTNVARLMPSIPGYMYAQKQDSIYVNLFIASNAQLKIGKQNVQIKQENNYPWNGDLRFIVSPDVASDFSLLVRIPGWAQNQAIPSDLYKFASLSTSSVSITVNGKPYYYALHQGYAVIKRNWKKNDVVKVMLPMEIRKVKSDTLIKDNIGKIALQRGPLMYCAEWKDNQGSTSNIIFTSASKLNARFDSSLLNGVTVLTSNTPVVHLGKNGDEIKTINRPFTAIPYYSWANRGKGEMSVWLPEKSRTSN